MKVLQILPELNAGWVERGTLELARALVAAGHSSLVVSNGGRLVAELEGQGNRQIRRIEDSATLPLYFLVGIGSSAMFCTAYKCEGMHLTPLFDA